jgi:hypothetical protein
MANVVEPDMHAPKPGPKPKEFEAALVAFQKRLKGTCLYIAGDNPGNTASRYSFARHIQPVLLAIARTGRGEPADSHQIDFSNWGIDFSDWDEETKEKLFQIERSTARRRRAQLPKGVQEIELNMSITYPYLRIKDGQFSLVADRLNDLTHDFLDALTASDPVRIRECPVCHRIFWALRTKAQVCSNRCRVRKWQLDNPADWARIQNKHERRRRRAAASRRRSAASMDPLACNRCGAALRTSSALVAHKREHTRRDAAETPKSGPQSTLNAKKPRKRQRSTSSKKGVF